MRDTVARVRNLLLDATSTAAAAPETQARKDFALYEFNTAPALTLIQSEEARACREICRIAEWYGWWGEVARAIDAERAHTLESMSLAGLQTLMERMRRLEDCAQEGLDPPDAPPAR